jgi:hypothetical protein
VSSINLLDALGRGALSLFAWLSISARNLSESLPVSPRPLQGAAARAPHAQHSFPFDLLSICQALGVQAVGARRHSSFDAGEVSLKRCDPNFLALGIPRPFSFCSGRKNKCSPSSMFHFLTHRLFNNCRVSMEGRQPGAVTWKLCRSHQSPHRSSV